MSLSAKLKFSLSVLTLLIFYSCDNKNPSGNYADIGISRYSNSGLEENSDSLDLSLFDKEGLFLRCTDSNYSFLSDQSLIYLTDIEGETFNKLYVINTVSSFYPYLHPIEIWESGIFYATEDQKSYVAHFSWKTARTGIDYSYVFTFSRSDLGYDLIKTDNNESDYRYRNTTSVGRCEIDQTDFLSELKNLIEEVKNKTNELRLEYEKEIEATKEKNKI